MIDLKRYYRLYPKGLCWVERIKDNEFVIKFKRFDNETGVELSPEPQYATLEDLIKDKEELSNKLDAINSILLDISRV